MMYFSLPADAVSFLLYAPVVRRGDSNFTTLFELKNPDGTDLFSQQPKIASLEPGDHSSILVPKAPKFVTKPGQWSYRVGSVGAVADDVDLKLVIRIGPIPTNTSSLRIQPFLASAQYKAVDIQPALNTMRTIYEQAGIGLEILDTIELIEEDFQSVSSNFSDAVTSQLINKGIAGQVNLFFVDDQTDGSSLGISAGIPGSLGIRGHRNGVLIFLSIHKIGNTLHSNLLSETTAHEMGHFLGLYHTSEKNGFTHDILNDTPECSIINDTNGNTEMNIDECQQFGSENLMFWGSRPDFRQTQITQDQASVIHFSPIAR
jgi:hypothetical protein